MSRPQDRMWRALVRVVERMDYATEGYCVKVVVPAWHPTALHRVSLASVPPEIARTMHAGKRLYAKVNIGAPAQDLLRFIGWEKGDPVMTYSQAKADRLYLWASFGEPKDGPSGEHEDLNELLDSPTETTACALLISHITEWMERGPDPCSRLGHGWMEDPTVRRIAQDYGVEEEFDAMCEESREQQARTIEHLTRSRPTLPSGAKMR